MIEWYRPILALHVIAVISWMAGILYLYRLLVYAAENGKDHEKVKSLLQLMSRRLLKAITIPAMICASCRHPHIQLLLSSKSQSIHIAYVRQSIN